MALADEAGISKPPRPPPKGVLQKPPALRTPPNAGAAARPPHRTAPLPPAFRRAGKPPPRRRSSVCRRVCCFAVLFVVFALFLLALAGAVGYLYLQPRLPLFRVQAVQIPRFNATTRADGSGTFLDAAAVVKIFASNQNAKISLSCGPSDADVYVSDEDGDVPVGSGSAAGFYLGRRNATVMRFRAEVKGELVDDAVGARLRQRMRSREIRFGVQVRTAAGLEVGGKAMARISLRIDCPPATLKQAKAGGPKCDLYLFRWIHLN